MNYVGMLDKLCYIVIRYLLLKVGNVVLLH